MKLEKSMGNSAYPLEKKIAFITSIYPAARECSRATGCSWELILAQAAQETGWGEKVLPGTYNIFNIKADSGWAGKQKTFSVWEMEKGKKITVDAPFRVYDSILDSLHDRQAFLRANKRYAEIHTDDVKGDFVREAEVLRKGGYATDERYAISLKEVFEGKTMQLALDAARAAHPTASLGLAGCSSEDPLPAITVDESGVSAMSTAVSTMKSSVKARGSNQTTIHAADCYTVKRGDTLSGIASAYGTTYTAIARLNGIVPPYTIYPNQVLNLPEALCNAG